VAAVLGAPGRVAQASSVRRAEHDLAKDNVGTLQGLHRVTTTIQQGFVAGSASARISALGARCPPFRPLFPAASDAWHQRPAILDRATFGCERFRPDRRECGPDLDLRLRRPIGNSALFGRASSARKAVTRELFRKPYPCRVWQGARSATSP